MFDDEEVVGRVESSNRHLRVAREDLTSDIDTIDMVLRVILVR